MLFSKKKRAIHAFADGEAISIEQVPDEVFSKKMMGEGIAIYPSEGTIVSPCNGRITLLNDNTKHAIGVVNEDGLEMLIHIGLDTMESTDAFKHHVKIQDQISVGQPLVSYDKAYFKEHNLNDITMLVVVDLNGYKIDGYHTGEVTAKEDVLIDYK